MSLIPAGTIVVVETRFFPPLVVDLTPEPAGTPPGVGGFITSQLKPRVTLKLKGQQLAQAAPYGDPTPSQWPKVRVALIVAGALIAFSILRILK